MYAIFWTSMDDSQISLTISTLRMRRLWIRGRWIDFSRTQNSLDSLVNFHQKNIWFLCVLYCVGGGRKVETVLIFYFTNRFDKKMVYSNRAAVKDTSAA